ncbi:MAG: magnesium chelatase ATPase subunit I [Acidiphilium sp. 34-60-192]|nr:MAG: magnesium chelatase ATPase subunit I [Acidiphilium sp. 34-60-192]
MVYPFSAIVGQQDMTNALLIAAIEPALGGVLAFGDRGTGKSTAIRALAALLPSMRAVAGCRYRCDPADRKRLCTDCRARLGQGSLPAIRIAAPVVDLPLGATEDRVIGALDLERALADGSKHFEPGLLAGANRGFLYIDEINLLEDHLVDLLLDVAASGENVVEREGLSLRHPARFVLIGSGNPEEGELRPQLLDRFGLCVEVRTPTDIDQRLEVVRRRDAFERNPPEPVLRRAATLCIALGTDGLRGELTLVRAARAKAALDGDDCVTETHLRDVAPAALRHRLRRDPLDESLASTRVLRAMDEVFAPARAAA